MLNFHGLSLRQRAKLLLVRTLMKDDVVFTYAAYATRYAEACEAIDNELHGGPPSTHRTLSPEAYEYAVEDYMDRVLAGSSTRAAGYRWENAQRAVESAMGKFDEWPDWLDEHERDCDAHYSHRKTDCTCGKT